MAVKGRGEVVLYMGTLVECEVHGVRSDDEIMRCVMCGYVKWSGEGEWKRETS
jgi:hypothetical protein